MCASHLWKKVIEDLDVANPKVLAAHNLRQQYIKFLLPYECALHDENYDDVLAMARRKWHMNSSTAGTGSDVDNKDTEEKGNTEPVGQSNDTSTSAVSHSNTTIPGSDTAFSQSSTTNAKYSLEQQNLGFPMVPKSNEINKSPRIHDELTSSLPTPLQQQRDPLDSLSTSLNTPVVNKQAHLNCSSPKNMQGNYSNSPSAAQPMNTGRLNNDWNRRPDMWNQPYPPDQSFKGMPGQPKGYYGDPYHASMPRHPMYSGSMSQSMGNHPVEYAEYQRHGIRPPVPYQPRQSPGMQQMMSDPYRPYRFGRSGVMDYQMHGSAGGMMMPPGSPMMPEWAWKQQQQQQQQQQHHQQQQQQQVRMGSPYGSPYGSHLSPQQQLQQHHHHHRVPSPMMLQQQQQQQQQAFAARLEQQQQQQHHHHHHHPQHQQQHNWQEASLRMSKAPYPTSAAQPATIKSQAVIGMPPQQHLVSTSADTKTTSLSAALEKKVPPEWVNTVEGTKPVFTKKRKLTSNDCGQ